MRWLAKERKHEGIGVLDRTREMIPGLVLVITLRILSGCSGRESLLFRMVGNVYVG